MLYYFSNYPLYDTGANLLFNLYKLTIFLLKLEVALNILIEERERIIRLYFALLWLPKGD